MSDIHINIADVERLRSELRAAKSKIEASVKGVQGAHGSADWKDPNSKRFGDMLKSAMRGTASFCNDADEMDRLLGRVIDQAKKMRQGG